MRQFKFGFFVLIAFSFTPFFAQDSVTSASVSPVQSPVVASPGSTAGVTELWQKTQKLYEQKEYKKALSLGLKVFDLAKAAENKDLTVASAELIADIFKISNNYEKALAYYKIELMYLDTPSTAEKKLKVYNYVSRVYFDLKKPDSAEIYLEKIINHPNQSKEIEILKAKAYSNFAAMRITQKQPKEAEYYANLALEINKKYNINKSIIYNLNNLGSIYMLQEQYDMAEVSFLRALTYLEEEQIDEKLIRIKESVLDNLSYTLYKLKDYKAYKYQEQAIDIRDSIRDAQISNILTEIEGKYNKEKIKKEEQLKTAEEIAKRKHTQDINIILVIISISLIIGVYLIYRYLKLRHENLQLEITQSHLLKEHEIEKIEHESQEKILNATLDGKESERKMIAETLHHSVSSLLSSAGLHLQAYKMQMNSVPPEEIEKAHSIINEAAEKIRNLSHSLVSTVLLKFGLQYAIQELCEKYSNSMIQFTCNCSDLKRYAPEFELKINSIIDELLNNIIKHSKADKASISLYEKTGFLEILIEDNGRGFNAHLIQENTGLGLKQIEARISKMQGEFKITSSLNKGVKIDIKVPIINI